MQQRLDDNALFVRKCGALADLADLILSSPSSPFDSVLAPSDANDRESENDSRFVLGVENAWEVGRKRSTFGLSLHL